MIRTPFMKNALQTASTRPYLIRALFEWCNDNAFTPYIAVKVDAGVQVPKEYVQNGEIVLNISLEATSGLQLGNDFVEFKARFGGTPRQIIVPIGQVIAIYARENGQGMAFPAPTPSSQADPGLGKSSTETQTMGPGPSPLTLMTNEESLDSKYSKDKGVKLEGVESSSETAPLNPTSTPTPGNGRPKLTLIK